MSLANGNLEARDMFSEHISQKPPKAPSTTTINILPPARRVAEICYQVDLQKVAKYGRRATALDKLSSFGFVCATIVLSSWLRHYRD